MYAEGFIGDQETEPIDIHFQGHIDDHDGKHVHQQHFTQELKRDRQLPEPTAEQKFLQNTGPQPEQRPCAEHAVHLITAEECKDPGYSRSNKCIFQQLAQFVSGDRRQFAAKVLFDPWAGVTFVFVLYEPILRLLSYFWPITIARKESLMGPLDIRWENGHKVLNSRNGNQSFGSLHEVWRETFKRIDPRTIRIDSVLALGLGGGSVPQILRREWKVRSPITVIDIDPVMLDIAKEHFGLNDIDNMTIIQGDAIVQLHSLKKRFDLILVDLFDDLDMARGVETNGFAHGLRDHCNTGGMVCFNTVAYDAGSDARCDRVLTQLKKVFSRVNEFRFEGVNRVFVAT